MRNFQTKTLLTALLLLCSTVATAYDFVVDGIYYNITDATAKTVAVTGFKNIYSGAVTIPATVTYNGTTYGVTSIESGSFCENLISVTIPNCVEKIKGSAFLYCTSLKELRIEDGEKTLHFGFAKVAGKK
ncbi:MAG: leucine-rich repeat protein [Bacteroidaceae bacterium]|nr:leucine-rich repeat protein [Bacteroidaceae bacterium]